jgi:hypothetical protein
MGRRLQRVSVSSRAPAPQQGAGGEGGTSVPFEPVPRERAWPCRPAGPQGSAAGVWSKSCRRLRPARESMRGRGPRGDETLRRRVDRQKRGQRALRTLVPVDQPEGPLFPKEADAGSSPVGDTRAGGVVGSCTSLSEREGASSSLARRAILGHNRGVSRDVVLFNIEGKPPVPVSDVNAGFSPRPSPRPLLAWRATPGGTCPVDEFIRPRRPIGFRIPGYEPGDCRFESYRGYPCRFSFRSVELL